MRASIGKWGNSLAIRLPAECVRVSGIKDGESVDVTVTATGEILIAPAKAFDKPAFLARLTKLRSSMPMTRPVIEDIRRQARY